MTHYPFSCTEIWFHETETVSTNITDYTTTEVYSDSTTVYNFTHFNGTNNITMEDPEEVWPKYIEVILHEPAEHGKCHARIGDPSTRCPSCLHRLSSPECMSFIIDQLSFFSSMVYCIMDYFYRIQ